MSQSTNTSVINFCDVCNLSLESKKGLYKHQSYDLKHKELLEKMFESEEEEISESVYDSDEDEMIMLLKLKPKPKTTSTLKLDRRSHWGTKGKAPFTDMNVKNVMKNLGIK